ncbi:MAG: hypothetical protein HRU43_08005, partial [Simkaniaceae bacterium]|nr:hypothetical protein [Simkaniaceae bacterium]
SLGKHIFKEDYTQKWKWTVRVLVLGITTLTIKRDRQISLGKSCLISLALSSTSHAIAYYAFPQGISRRKPIHRDPIHTAPSVLGAILPEGDFDTGKNLFYYYIASDQGFSLIFYHVDMKDSRIPFTHGCDPIGSFAHPMISDVRFRRVPPDIYDLVIGKMRATQGYPPFMTLKGTWTASDQSVSEKDGGSKLKTLLSSSQLGRFERYPEFDLEVLEGFWKVLPHHPDLKGIRFNFFDRKLRIWMHESNASAIPSALKIAQKEFRKLVGSINTQTKLIENCKSFLNNGMNSRRFLSKLPGAKKTPHSKELIQSTHQKSRVSESFEDEVKTILQNANLYVQSLNKEKQRAERALKELEDYKATFEALQSATDEAEIARLTRELSNIKCPTSYLVPTIQIKQACPIDQRVLSYLKRNNLLETVNLFKLSKHRRLISSFDTDEIRSVLSKGHALLKEKAAWIIRNPKSGIRGEEKGFEKDWNIQKGKAENPTWEEVEWLLNKFAQYKVNFQMMRTFPFTDKDIEWYEEV